MNIHGQVYRTSKSFRSSLKTAIPFTDPDMDLVEFECMLDKLRPNPTKVEAIITGDSDEVGVLIYVTNNGKRKLQYSLEPEVRNLIAFQDEVAVMTEFYRYPPRLWPGCRGTIARYLGCTLSTEFNKWFDTIVNASKKRVN